MYPPRRTFVNVRSALLVAGGFAIAGLAGCTSRVFAEGEIDPTSPVKGEIASTARANADFPSFTEVPAKPSDMRPVLAYGAAADRVKAERDALERDTAPGTWSLTGQDTADFAARASKAAGPEAPAATTDTDAYASALRRRATPPPPPKR